MNFVEMVGEVQFLNRSEAGILLHVLAIYLQALDSGNAKPGIREKPLRIPSSAKNKTVSISWEPDF